MNNPNFLKLFKKFFRVLHCGKQEKEETISRLLFSVNPKTNLTYEKNSNYVITIIVP